MSQSETGPRPTCLRCRRALSVCWCAHSATGGPGQEPGQDAGAELVFLQHPREARNPIGTARMAHLGVVGSQLRIGIDFAEDPVVMALLRDAARHAVVLYPTDAARPVEELRDAPRPLRIFILDGTWWQAGKLWQRNPWLHALPAYRLAPSAPGQYRIRREPAAHCLATVEAVAQLLDALAGRPEQTDHASLLAPFHVMVERQLAYAQSPARTPRHRLRPRPVRQPPRELAAIAPRLLLVHGEGNGWPARKRGGPEHELELMQWLALRPATGERFHALVQTRTRAPDVLGNQGLSQQELAGALSPAAFLDRWQSFLRDDDALCAWGYFPASLLKQAGGAARPMVNLQRICTQWLRRRMSQAEQALTALGGEPAPAEFPGRGGRRIAAMAAVVRALLMRT